MHGDGSLPGDGQVRVVGVDLGGTKIAGALVGSDGRGGDVLTVPTPADSGPAALLDAVARLVSRLAATVEGPGSVRGVGIGTAGVVDVGAGMILSATDVLPGWTGTAVVDGLRSRLAGSLDPGVRIHVQNDVDAHAAGEAWLGAAAGLDDVLLVAVGTGVGGAVVRNGVVLRGAHHVAGEIGHLPVPGAEGLRCSCGRTGHLEALASGLSLHRRYVALGGSGTGNAHEVFSRAASGDALAVRAVQESGTAVGRALAGAVTLLDPDAVVVSGGVAGSGEMWWQAMESTLRAELIDPLAGIPVLRPLLGARSAVVGAARGALDLLEEKP
ncbi:ROK family protein [Georgenia halophila]|uniref:ROK family protein n=1 Tax=Georgenia halophila TaxID=620889 RepID=A0ABP8KTR9_9MICO